MERMAPLIDTCLHTERAKHQPIGTAREPVNHMKSEERTLVKTKSFTKLPGRKPNKHKRFSKKR